MDSVLQLVGFRNAPQNKKREENKQEDESQQDKSGLNCNRKIPVATVVNTDPPEIPEEEEVQVTNQNQAGHSDSSHSKNLNEKSGQKGNLTFSEQGSIESTVAQSTAGNTSDSDKIEDKLDEEYVQYSSEDGMSLGRVSICSGEVQEVICNLHDYMLKDGKKKGEFLIDDVVEEENEILDCDSNIDREEIDDLHLMTE
eukprot:13920837-Ditylum_brightwellii.AAC.1